MEKFWSSSARREKIGARHVRDGLFWITIMRVAPNKGDGAGDVIAFPMANHRLAGFGGAEIIDPQIQRCLRLDRACFEPDGKAGCHIHQRKNWARRKNAGGRVAY